MRMPGTCRPLGWRCGHFQTAGPLSKPGFQEKSLMIINLMSNNFDTSKIHYVVVFVDMAGDLGVMVEHRNSPFVFCNPGFSDRSVWP